MPRKKLARALKLPVVFEPDDGGWHVHVPSLQGCRSWGRSLTEARRNIREAISLYEEELDDAERYAQEVELEENIRLAIDANALLNLSRTAKELAEAQVARAKAVAILTAHKLADAQISLRDAGELLGLSPEGVRKLLKAPLPENDELTLAAHGFAEIALSRVTFKGPGPRVAPSPSAVRGTRKAAG